jgi:hypothetical protein
MTIEMRTAAFVAAALLLLLSCVSNEARRGDRLDVTGYPEDIKDAYRVFAFRCSRCHTLARPLNARIDDEEHWVQYVRRMRRQSGSGIDAQNGEVILKFLLYYHRDKLDKDRAEESEPAAPEPVETPTAPPASMKPSAAPEAVEGIEPSAPAEAAPAPTPPEGPKELAP